jgi:hypothetical protein
MTLDEHIADFEARLDEFRLKLDAVMASAIPPRVEMARIRAIGQQVADFALAFADIAEHERP